MLGQSVEQIMRVKLSRLGQDKAPTFPSELVIVLRASSTEVSEEDPPMPNSTQPLMRYSC